MPNSRGLSRTPAFWLVAAALLLLTFAAAAPSPLYVVYQAAWGFSSGTLTVVFAVYALFLLLALTTVGSLSDFLGRKPLLYGSLLLEAAAMLLFTGADGVGPLLLARAVQGFATGAATGALSATLVDLQPQRSPGLGALVNGAASTLGLALGAFGSGLLVQYGPAPRVLVFALLAAGFLLAVAALALVPETAGRRPGALASLVPRARVPRQARRAFAVGAPALVAVWSLGGLYLSLGPSLAAGVLHLHNHLVGGLVVSTMTAAGTLGSLLLRGRPARTTLRFGGSALTLGVLGTLLALDHGSTPLFFAMTALAGLGFGATFLGVLSGIAPLAAPAERAELFAAVYVLSYLAFSAPAVAAGFAAPHFGLLATATGYGAAVALLALVTLATTFVRPRPAARPNPVEAACPAETGGAVRS
ncbi:MFS transporter [Kitasatospora sp. NPDC001540]|uniref:MFS transporter n=1 Tax=Kitasatospora sp. NPDC001540 TaxID=3364014 RepID=UPI0036A0A932